MVMKCAPTKWIPKCVFFNDFRIFFLSSCRPSLFTELQSLLLCNMPGLSWDLPEEDHATRVDTFCFSTEKEKPKRYPLAYKDLRETDCFYLSHKLSPSSCSVASQQSFIYSLHLHVWSRSKILAIVSCCVSCIDQNPQSRTGVWCSG